ncbi:MAG: hypothetical protein ACP5E9_08350 [Candidatus Methanospirareceae archaeon]
MNAKKRSGILGLTLVVVLVISIFITLIPTSMALTHTIKKVTLSGPGGTEEIDKQYSRGEMVYYRYSYTPNSEGVWINKIIDEYPDGTFVTLYEGNISLAQGETYSDETTWPIPNAWPKDYINNRIYFNITSKVTGLDDMGTASCQNIVLAQECAAKATADPACYYENGTWITFDGSGSYGVGGLKYAWTFTGGFTGDNDNGAVTKVFVTAPITATLTITDSLGCTHSTSVRVPACPDTVPVFTPIGMVGLVAVLGALGLGTITLRKRR